MKKLKLIFLVFILIISGCSNSDINKEMKFSDIYPGNYKKITKITCGGGGLIPPSSKYSYADFTDKTEIREFLDALEKYTFTFDENQNTFAGSEYGINFYEKKDKLILVCSVTQDRVGLGHPDTLNSGVYYRVHGGKILDTFSEYLHFYDEESK